MTELNTDIRISRPQWREAVARIAPDITIDLVRDEVPTSDSISPNARKRQEARVGSWERGTNVRWSLTITVRGIDPQFFLPTQVERILTKKEALANIETARTDVIEQLEEIWDDYLHIVAPDGTLREESYDLIDMIIAEARTTAS